MGGGLDSIQGADGMTCPKCLICSESKETHLLVCFY